MDVLNPPIGHLIDPFVILGSLMVQFAAMSQSARWKYGVRTSLFFVIICAPCYGQAQEPVVTGHCYGQGSQPGCVLPNLFGPTGLTLYNPPPPAFSHYAHFVGSAQATLNQTLSTAIATQLAILPIISPSSGFTYKYDSAAGAFVRTTTSFGPIYTERAETIGRGNVSFGISYQRFRFSNLDGIDLHNVPAVFTHLETAPIQPYEADIISTSNSINLNMDQTMLYGSVGLTDRLDISVAVPIVSVRMGASSDAQIVRVSGNQVTLVNGLVINNPHQFTAAPDSLTNVFTSNGSATGLGDVTVRVKGNVLQTDAVRVALAMDVRTPSGNARELLGSGAIGVKPFVAVSTGKRFSPHLNLGYEWNGQSILAGDITTDSKGRLPSEIFYSLGADFGATSRLSFAFDYLGQALFNAPRVFQSTFTTLAIPGGRGSETYPTITGGKDNVGLNSGAVGLKYELFGNLLLTADVLFPLDNKGLRQDVTPLIGLSYAFGH